MAIFTKRLEPCTWRAMYARLDASDQVRPGRIVMQLQKWIKNFRARGEHNPMLSSFLGVKPTTRWAVAKIVMVHLCSCHLRAVNLPRMPIVVVVVVAILGVRKGPPSWHVMNTHQHLNGSFVILTAYHLGWSLVWRQIDPVSCSANVRPWSNPSIYRTASNLASVFVWSFLAGFSRTSNCWIWWGNEECPGMQRGE